MQIALAERCVRSCKAIFFKILLIFSTISYTNAIKLTQSVYNSRRHSGIFNYRPTDVHFDSHLSSLVARLNIRKLNLKQRRLKRSIFSLHPSRKFQIGERVLVKKKRTAFYKPSSVFEPQFQTEPTVITDTNTKYLPHSYRVASAPDRWLYAFELKKVGRHYGSLETSTSQEGEKIQVLDYTIESAPVTRSGLRLKNRDGVFYSIMRGNAVEKVNAETLRFFKKVLGPHSLKYHEIFFRPENRYLII